jgi:hypothetical protein
MKKRKKDPNEVQKSFDQLPEDVKDIIKDAFAASENVEEFTRELMVGDCPKCGSNNTRDCAVLFQTDQEKKGVSLKWP